MQDLTREELEATFGSVGEDVRVHRSVVVFGGKQIHLTHNIRIDAFAMLSAGPLGIHVDHHVHVGAGAYLYGSGGRIDLEPFCSLSARAILYTASDDFTGGAMAGPLVPDALRHVQKGDVRVGRHALVGAGSVVMPGVAIGDGAAVGALSLVRSNVAQFYVVAGCPARRVGLRGTRMLVDEWKVPGNAPVLHDRAEVVLIDEKGSLRPLIDDDPRDEE